MLKGDRSHLGAFQIRFPFGKTLTVNVFRQRINQLFQGCGDIWRAIALHSLWDIAISDYPPIPSQGKNLNMGAGDRIALPTGHRSPRGTFHVRFAVGKTLTVNVFRQKMNQLFQGVEDIWRAIAFSVPPVPSQGKNLNILKGDCEALPTGDRIALPTGSHITPPMGDRSW
ncbi:hypothetical protein CEP11_14575 [Cylindrospermopsis raciborskii S10]|nr:hypothetical protein CEP11_14575 [Cylindrospermopsis raciborskii S10]PNK05862.1 hypothetical protein CEP12_10290 [Cylindrospermopsis raciborskii S14]